MPFKKLLTATLFFCFLDTYANLEIPASEAVITSVVSSSPDVRGGVVKLENSKKRSASPSAIPYAASGYAGG